MINEWMDEWIPVVFLISNDGIYGVEGWLVRVCLCI